MITTTLILGAVFVAGFCAGALGLMRYSRAVGGTWLPQRPADFQDLLKEDEEIMQRWVDREIEAYEARRPQRQPKTAKPAAHHPIEGSIH